MSAEIVGLCEAVVAELNAAPEGTFSQSFTAVHEYDPDYSPVDCDVLRVVITDAGGTIERQTRSTLEYMDNVRIVVLWRCKQSNSGTNKERMDQGLTLVDEISEYLICLDLPDSPYQQTGDITRGTGGLDKQHYYPENMKDRVFASQLVVRYRRSKTRRS